MCISQDGISYSAVTKTSPNFHDLTHTILYLTHTTCEKWISMNFYTISDLGTQDDRELDVWNILGSCNRGRKILENHTWVLHCLSPNSSWMDICQGIEEPLHSKTYVLKLLFNEWVFLFLTNTSYANSTVPKPKLSKKPKLAKTIYSYACKRNISHPFCFCRSSKRVWKEGELYKVNGRQCIRVRFLEGVWGSFVIGL